MNTKSNNIYTGKKLSDPEFSPMLIGVDQEKAERHGQLFQKAIKILNQIVDAIESYLGMVQFEDIINIIQAENIDDHLKKLFIERKQIKFEIENAQIEKKFLYEMIRFPNSSRIIALVEKLNGLFHERDSFIAKSLKKNLEKLFIDDQFAVIPEIRELIQSNYRVYTRSVNENLILIALQKLADAINILNIMTQGFIIPSQLHGSLKSLFRPIHVQGHIYTLELKPSIFNVGIFRNVNKLQRTPEIEGFLQLSGIGIDSERGKFFENFDDLNVEFMQELGKKIKKELKKQASTEPLDENEKDLYPDLYPSEQTEKVSET